VVDRYLRPWKARLYAPLVRRLARVSPDAVTVAGLAVGLAAAAAAALGRFEWALAGWWLNRLLDGLDGELARAARRHPSQIAPGRAPRGRHDAAPGAAPDGRPLAGAYLDLMTDLVVYAALPLGLAAGAAGTLTGVPLAAPPAVWAAAAFALAAFYLNLGSLALLGPALEAREAEEARATGAARADAPVRTTRAARDAADAGGGRGNDLAASEAVPGLRMPAGLMEGAETVVAFSLALWWPAWAIATLTVIGGLTLLSAVQRWLWGMRRLRRSAA
jgi:hypothetical protein